MSSGVEADIALDAAVVLTLGMNRVLGRTAGVAGKAAEALAAKAAGRAEARAAALAEVEAYEQAVRAVLERQARIEALKATRDRVGADVVLPEELKVGEQEIAELVQWCEATDAVLDEAERRIAEHVAAGVTAELFATPAGLTGPQVGEPPKPSEIQATLERVLARLLPDASDEDRRAVAEAARLLAEAPGGEAEGVLTEVRLRVSDANRRTEEQRAEERRRAEEREAAEQAEAERVYVLDSITSAFEDMGYEVQTGFETLTAKDGTVVLSKGSWPDHSVKMRVDAGQVRAAMRRERPVQSEDDRRVDVEREREWCDAFEAARARLEEAGIRSDVTWRLDPGVQELPVSGDARQTRSRDEPREHRRERER